MIKISYLNDFQLLDPIEDKKTIYCTLDDLVSIDDVTFYFFNSSDVSIAIRDTLITLKSQYPNRHISMVWVHYGKEEVKQPSQYGAEHIINTMDEYICPVPYSNLNFILLHKKILRWTFSNINYLLLYDYCLISLFDMNIIKSIKKLEAVGTIKIIDITSKKIRDRLDTYAARLSDKEQIVLSESSKGTAFKQIAEKLAITVSQAKQLKGNARRKILLMYRRDK